ncbi:MAG: hypothetical protein P8N76_09270 [Pirellulaceae bacterium]|nr:hypothetical protein [Pirellulaceae bacterium]
MNGEIGELIFSKVGYCRELRKGLFCPNFQEPIYWIDFINDLSTGVRSFLSTGSDRWSLYTFQKLYVACWIHQPVAKGTFMIRLDGLSREQKQGIETAIERLSWRPSSHLSTKGHSAAVGGWFGMSQFNFLKGGQELLVQYEKCGDDDCLMLKCEGFTTYWGAVPHALSLFHKLLHKEGRPFNPVLEKFAADSPLGKSRAAENYGKGWEPMLETTRSSFNKYITVRKALEGLHQHMVTERGAALPHTIIDYDTADNEQLATTAEAFARHFEGESGLQVLRKTKWYRRKWYLRDRKDLGPKDQTDLVKELREIALTLRQDATSTDRYFLELYVSPEELDQTLRNFKNTAIECNRV